MRTENKTVLNSSVSIIKSIKCRVSVILAAMNEAESIQECLEKINRVFLTHNIDGEIVVADNSTDETPEIARQLGAYVVTPDKFGYGYALIYGINHANGSYIVMGDADGTYDFNDIPRLLAPLIDGKADLVIGSRFDGRILPRAMPWLHQYIGNPLLTKGLNWKLGTSVTDAHSGLRAFRKDIWDSMDHSLIPADFCSEMLKQMVWKGAHITEIPVTYYPRRSKMKAGTLIHGWRCFLFLLRHVMLTNNHNRCIPSRS